MVAAYTIAKSKIPTIITSANNDIIDGGDFKTNINAGNGINLVRTGKDNDVQGGSAALSDNGSLSKYGAIELGSA